MFALRVVWIVTNNSLGDVVFRPTERIESRQHPERWREHQFALSLSLFLCTYRKFSCLSSQKNICTSLQINQFSGGIFRIWKLKINVFSSLFGVTFAGHLEDVPFHRRVEITQVDSWKRNDEFAIRKSKRTEWLGIDGLFFLRKYMSWGNCNDQKIVWTDEKFAKSEG